MGSVYCDTCGAGLNETARFCRACGSPQTQPLPPPPPAVVPAGGGTVAARHPLQGPSTTLVGAILAIVGGVGMCFLALYTTIYLPLHYHLEVNYGESPRFGDLLAFGSGLVAIAIGAMAMTRRSGNRVARGVVLALAGTPTLILALLWSFPETFHLESEPIPFYIGDVYFGDIGIVHIASGYVPLPLLVACAAVIVGGVMMATAQPARPGPLAGGR